MLIDDTYGAFPRMPGAGLSSLNGSNDSIVTPILQIRRLRHGEAKYIRQLRLPSQNTVDWRA